MSTSYTQLGANAFGLTEIADASATIAPGNTATHFTLLGGGAHTGWSIQFDAATGNTFSYNGSNEPIFLDPGNDLVASVDIWSGATEVATFSGVASGGSETFLDQFWGTYKNGGALNGGVSAFQKLLGKTNETGDSHDNTLEDYGTSSTLNGGAGGNDRYIVRLSFTSIVDGGGNGTVIVGNLVSGMNFNMGGGTNTLLSNMNSFIAHATSGDALTGFHNFNFGSAARSFTLDPSFIPNNAAFDGNGQADAVLMNPTTSYNASGWTFSNFANPGSAVYINAKDAPGAVTIEGPNGLPHTYITDNGLGSTLVGGDHATTFNLTFGATHNLIGGSGPDDEVFLPNYIGDFTVTEVGPNEYNIDGPNGFHAHTKGVEKYETLSEAGFLADRVRATPPPPVNHPPVVDIFSASTDTWANGRSNGLSGEGFFTDPDGDSMTFTAHLAGGQPLPSWVHFDTKTAHFSGKPPTNFTAKFTIEIRATDSHGAKAATPYTLYLNVDDPPDILGSAIFHIAEGTRRVTVLKAQDANIHSGTNRAEATTASFANQHLTWSIAGGVDKADFTVNASTGLLKFKFAPDFRHPQDANHDNTYIVKVRVSDGFFSDTAKLAVSVTNSASARTEGFATHDVHHASDPAPSIEMHPTMDWLLAT